ncbi:MFS general substrate transporter [Laetiporus sulphureus 93-53]|uniref:MFS general substrate transporter n=1 Tax=Laetiporus sulphureus 93-53 TaxID=1314785 RepID=A0A165C5R2_9APHY|nr:MFS general substrate transporter [Laetiporus sulphureus 93-53]KZT02251.1 MFS general substrate transporter [Laetiporus sulphureus 93-53]
MASDRISFATLQVRERGSADDVSVKQETIALDKDAESSPASAPPEINFPDGGTIAWLQVVGSFFLFFNSWGIINTFGAFQTYYEGNLLSAYSPSTISWVGSIQGFLLLVIGVMTGPIFDMGYFHSLIAVGSFMVVFGMMMTSLATEYYQIFLAQGLCVGLGAGCLFVPSVVILATYFKKKRSFATGLATSGSSIGGVIYPTVFHQLQPKIGFGWATRIIGFIALATLSICFIIMRTRGHPPAKRQLIDKSAWKELPYPLFTLASFFAFVGLYIPFFYISAFAQGKTGASAELAFYLVPILNAASTFGRVSANYLADHVGTLTVITPCTFISGVLALCWIAVHDVGGVVVFAVLYGFFSGTIVSLSPSTVAHLTPDMKRMGGRMGMNFSISGLGLLIGSPIAGTILNLETHQFLKAQIFCGVMVLVAGVAMGAARVSKAGWDLRAKA